MSQIEQIKSVIATQRQLVFPRNLERFDAVCESFIAEIESRPFEWDTLTGKLSEIVRKHQRQDLSSAPPELCRRNDETTEQWLNRCYEAGGYMKMKNEPTTPKTQKNATASTETRNKGQ